VHFRAGSRANSARRSHGKRDTRTAGSPVHSRLNRATAESRQEGDRDGALCQQREDLPQLLAVCARHVVRHGVSLAGDFLHRSRASADAVVLVTVDVIAERGKWTRFDHRWQRILADEGVRSLHMKEFAHSTGQCASWKGEPVETRRQGLRHRATFAAWARTGRSLAPLVTRTVVTKVLRARSELHDVTAKDSHERELRLRLP
jgi:hypothetical protein